ncbi:MAG: hypothetical protein NWR72_20240 [Bacteroidia bacterium]|nr:hypothetical protein [Bacteroidia bacterium]
MRTASFLLVLTGAFVFSSCTSTRQASTTEYDDVYYSQSDAPEVIAVAQTAPVNSQQSQDRDNYAYNADRYRQPVDNYQEAYYGDDDFYFSRRVRRFNQPAAANWRYYDPFYANDLYYVMGTPAWNTWNNNGWFNPNYPRFGATLGWNNFNTFGGVGYGSPYWANSFSQWNSFNYYNPYVNAYYGYDPFFGRGFGNPYAFGFNNGFNNGFYNGFNNAFYCPPYGGGAFFASPGVGRNNNTTTRALNYRRPTSTSSTAQTTYTPTSSRPTNTRTSSTATGSSARPATQSTTSRATTTDNSRYLQPRPATERAATRTNVPSTYTRPTSTPSTQGTGSRTTTTTSTRESSVQPRVYTRPSATTTQERSSTRTSSTPATAPTRNYSTPSRTSTPSSSTPSRSSSPSASPSRSSSPSSSSRPSSSSTSPSSRPSSSSGSRRP